MLTIHGLKIPDDASVRRDLTFVGVSPIPEFKGPSLKAYLKNKNNLLVPKHYGGVQRADYEDVRLQPDNADLQFNGNLKESLSQNIASEKTLEKLVDCGGAVLVLPTGFGKTTVALYIAASLKKKTLIIVHKEFLADQWTERIRQFLGIERVGRVQGNQFDVDAPICIAMIQTLCTRTFPQNSFANFGLTIVDECHHVPAAAFSRAMFQCQTKYTLGVTATPERKDGLQEVIHVFLGPESFRAYRECDGKASVIVIRFKSDELAECPIPLASNGRVSTVNYVTELVKCVERTQFLVDCVKKLDVSRKILILTDRRSHAEKLVAMLEDAGLYIGGMKADKMAESAEKRFIVGTFSLAAEGLDIPSVDTVVLATPKADVTQAIGRCMRGDGKGRRHDPLIVDVVDEWGHVGFSMFRKRKHIYATQKIKIDD